MNTVYRVLAVQKSLVHFSWGDYWCTPLEDVAPALTHHVPISVCTANQHF